MADRTETFLLPAFPRVSDCSGLWAIEASAAAGLAARARSTDWAAHLAAFDARGPRPQAAVQLLSAGNGKSVAVVRLDGPLMKAASSFGGASTVQARRDIRQALADADVSAILLAIDSPGGTVSGTDDLAAEVKAATKSKPVFAFVSDLCASAAYWVASQADAIYANSDTAWVGSIGTFMAMYDLSKAATEGGVEAVVFRTGPLKGAGAMDGDPITDEQRANYQGLVEESQKSFDAAVKKGRKFSDKQLAAVRTGGVFTADAAVANGLIDGVQSLEATVSMLVKEANSRSRSARGSAAATSPDRGIPMAATKTANDDDVIALEVAPDFTGSRKAQAAEYRRVASIQTLCAKHPAIAAEAIENGWTADKAEVAAMRADLPKPPAAVNPHAAAPGGKSGEPADADVIEASMLLSLGVKPKFVAGQLPSSTSEAVMNRATARENRGYSLHALMDATLRAAGKTFHGNRRSESFARAAVQADRQLHDGETGGLRADGGFTTISLSGILANVANKVMLARYAAQDTTWDQFAAVRSHNDFKIVTRYRMDSTGAFRKVGPDGELKHVGLQDTSYTNKVDTYGAMIALTRQMQINDDLNAFAEVPGFLGDMAAIRVEEAAYVLLLSNAGSFFSAGNKNLIAGAGSAFGEPGVTAAETSFRNQVSANGKPILTKPSVLLVPTTLEVAANKLNAGATVISIGGGTTPNTITDGNPHVGKYPPVVSPYLNNTAIRDQDARAITGQSDTGWYLFADPASRAAIGVAFLNGQRLPTIESTETEFQTLGMQWRGYLDFGVGFEDPTAALKSAGA